MEKRIPVFLLLIVFAMYSCEEVPSSSQGQPAGDIATADTSNLDSKGGMAMPLERPNCEIEGTVLEGNSFWAKSENLVVAITATEESNDADLGESHRVLVVYDGKSCQSVFKEILPINISADFPYHLSDITYSNVSKVVAVRGADRILIFDLVSKKLSEPLNPKFLNERYSEDGQSGMIQRLEIWENYLVGYSSGSGAFVFDLEDPMAAKALLPAAEYELERGTDYSSMFFLESKGAKDKCQAILPIYDLNTGQFTVNPMFEVPLEIQRNLNPSFRNNRFIVLKEIMERDQKPVGIDMKARKQVEIPANIATKKDTEIINWMKNQ